ncbi:MAG: ATP-binding cassette domain-containing protein [Mycoplasmatales bacterium]
MKISIKNYTKKLKKKEVLKNINYEFESGKLYGLYGHNGSGKTMLLRALCGLIYSKEGEINIAGKILGKDITFLDSVGVLIEDTKLLPEYTGFTNLKLLNEIDNALTDEQIKTALRRVGLDPEDSRIVAKYSLGMNQKLVLAQAIMNEPKVLLLDEPTNGLDEETIELIRKELLRLKNLGTLIVIASHNKDDIRLLSDEIIGIKEGEIYEINKQEF